METIFYLIEGVWQALCDLVCYDAGSSVQQAWIGAAIGAASSLLNAGLGALSAAKQARNEKREYERQKSENQAWYNRRYNEDGTQRADAQRALTRINEDIKKRSLAAAGKKAVMGGTDASQAAVQQANAQAVGGALADITARADQRKDNVEASYRQRSQSLDAQHAKAQAAAEESKRNAIAQAATGVISSMASADFGEGKSGGTSNSKVSTVQPGDNTQIPIYMPSINQSGLDRIGNDISRSYKNSEDAWKENEKRLYNSWGGQ